MITGLKLKYDKNKTGIEVSIIRDTCQETEHKVQICTSKYVGVSVVRDTCQGADHKSQGCTSKYVGVDFVKRSGKWRANLGIDNIKLYLGYFKTEIEAAQVYNECALYFYGDDAKLNDVPKLEHKIFSMDKIIARYAKHTGKKYIEQLYLTEVI